jgi:hypothetical protein
MGTKMTHTARAELTNVVRRRYCAATAAEKRKILDEFIAVTGYHEKSAIRALNAENGPTRGWLSMRASGRLWTIKPWISRGFSRLSMSCWMVSEVFGRGRWWAVGDSDCSADPRPNKTKIIQRLA